MQDCVKSRLVRSMQASFKGLMLESGPTSHVTQATPAFKHLRACLVLQCYVDTFNSTEVNSLNNPIQQILLECQVGLREGK